MQKDLFADTQVPEPGTETSRIDPYRIIKEERFKVEKKNEDLQEFTTEEIMEASTRYFEGDTLAATVWMNKYALKDSDGHIYEKTPDDMHRRIARELHRIESRYPNPVSEEEAFSLMAHFRYIVPQGSPMAGIGNKFQISSLSNCFVVGNRGNSHWAQRRQRSPHYYKSILGSSRRSQGG